jgi:hypothetical protein
MLAPGDTTQTRSGTSYSAPLATGTVALLQEHAEARIGVAAPGWDADARRHEVMKATLMNSADKVEGLLGMGKTILDTSGQNWLQSEAAFFEHIPIDDQMGTGQLNASRAYQQFQNGEYDAGSANIPRIGWDYGITLGEEDVAKYVIGSVLSGGSFISATLAWDREVSFDVDADEDGEYDAGDTFEADGLTNLDLFLMPKGAIDIGELIWSSISVQYNVEHIFFEIPETGEYELWVHQVDAPLEDQPYALAWWSEGPSIFVPEPGSGTLLVAGLALLGARSARGRRIGPRTRP